MTWTEIATGGGIALAGTVVTQFSAIHLDHRVKKMARKDAAMDRKRTTLTQLSDAAKAYRAELSEEATRSLRGEMASPTEERALRTARMNYEALVHRVESSLTTCFEQWAEAAQNWALGDESVHREQALWKHCMATSGRQLQSYDT